MTLLIGLVIGFCVGWMVKDPIVIDTIERWATTNWNKVKKELNK